MAQRFVEEGAQVVITDVDEARGAKAAAEIGATFKAENVTSEAEWESTIGGIREQIGHLDFLVNNAGIFTSCPVDETPLEDFQRLMNMNVNGVFLGCKHGLRAMKQNPGEPSGSIINLSSVTGLRGQLGGAAYTSNKGAVRLLTKTVALDNAPNGIRCNSIHPGVIDTPMMVPIFAAAPDAEALRKQIKSTLPIGYMGDPARDIGNMAVYQASDESLYLTGTEMVVDGGMTIGLPS